MLKHTDEIVDAGQAVARYTDDAADISDAAADTLVDQFAHNWNNPKEPDILGRPGGAEKLLPNVEKVTVDTRKVTEYALNPNNTSGGANKARVFESALGYNQSNSNHLMQQIQSKLPTSNAILGTMDKYGQ